MYIGYAIQSSWTYIVSLLLFDWKCVRRQKSPFRLFRLVNIIFDIFMALFHFIYSILLFSRLRMHLPGLLQNRKRILEIILADHVNVKWFGWKLFELRSNRTISCWCLQTSDGNRFDTFRHGKKKIIWKWKFFGKCSQLKLSFSDNEFSIIDIQCRSRWTFL